MNYKFLTADYSFREGGWTVRHVYRDDHGRRCTAFYTVNGEKQAQVLCVALGGQADVGNAS